MSPSCRQSWDSCGGTSLSRPSSTRSGILWEGDGGAVPSFAGDPACTWPSASPLCCSSSRAGGTASRCPAEPGCRQGGSARPCALLPALLLWGRPGTHWGNAALLGPVMSTGGWEVCPELLAHPSRPTVGRLWVFLGLPGPLSTSMGTSASPGMGCLLAWGWKAPCSPCAH